MLELRKKGNKHWLLIDEEIGEFTPSKFTINRLNNVINIVYFNNLKSKEYNVSDCYIFDIDDTSGFNTSNGVAFMDKLEELNCPCFQKDETIIIGGVIDISGKLDKVSTAGVERAYIINADGSQGTKATSELKDVLEFTDFDAFPTIGETGKIYLALDTNKTYRWTGSVYVQIGSGGESSYKVIASNVVNSLPVTGTDVHVEVENFVIPANTFEVGDIILFRCRIIKTGSAGVVNHRHTLGAFGISFFQTGGLFSQVERTLIVKSATNTQDVSLFVSTAFSNGGYSSTSDVSINWTVNQNLKIKLNNQSVADSSLVSFWELSRIRK